MSLPSKTDGVRRILSRVIRIGALLAMLIAGATLLAKHWSVAELLTHFRLHYVLASIAAFGIALWLRLRLSAAILGITAVLHAVVLLPYLNASSPSASAGLRVFHANVLTSNQNYSAVAATIKSLEPDLIVIQEVDQRWIQSLQRLLTDYPAQKAVPQANNFGLFVLSREASTEFAVLEPGSDGVPAIAITFVHEGQSLRWLAQHTVPPVTPALAERRNQQLQGSAEWLSAQSRYRGLVGDLNITPFSPWFRELLRTADLHDPRQHHGYVATWPQLLGALGIPIDHILLGDGLVATELKRVPIAGSDHAGIIATIELAD